MGNINYDNIIAAIWKEYVKSSQPASSSLEVSDQLVAVGHAVEKFYEKHEKKSGYKMLVSACGLGQALDSPIFTLLNKPAASPHEQISEGEQNIEHAFGAMLRGVVKQAREYDSTMEEDGGGKILQHFSVQESVQEQEELRVVYQAWHKLAKQVERLSIIQQAIQENGISDLPSGWHSLLSLPSDFNLQEEENREKALFRASTMMEIMQRRRLDQLSSEIYSKLASSSALVAGLNLELEGKVGFAKKLKFLLWSESSVAPLGLSTGFHAELNRLHPDIAQESLPEVNKGLSLSANILNMLSQQDILSPCFSELYNINYAINQLALGLKQVSMVVRKEEKIAAFLEIEFVVQASDAAIPEHEKIGKLLAAQSKLFSADDYGLILDQAAKFVQGKKEKKENRLLKSRTTPAGGDVCRQLAEYDKQQGLSQIVKDLPSYEVIERTKLLQQEKKLVIAEIQAPEKQKSPLMRMLRWVFGWWKTKKLKASQTGHEKLQTEHMKLQALSTRLQSELDARLMRLADTVSGEDAQSKKAIETYMQNNGVTHDNVKEHVEALLQSRQSIKIFNNVPYAVPVENLEQLEQLKQVILKKLENLEQLKQGSHDHLAEVESEGGFSRRAAVAPPAAVTAATTAVAAGLFNAAAASAAAQVVVLTGEQLNSSQKPPLRTGQLSRGG